MKITMVGRLIHASAWAVGGPVRNLNVSRQYYYVGLALLIVVVGIAVFKAYRVWEDLHAVEESDSPADLLQTFEDARAAGEIDDAELERVREKLGFARKKITPKSTANDVDPTTP